ncbi:MAG TPA: ATP-binding protein [Gaiellaceae bacterium]|nr:ATP-binding protein [Gaiellaceae bacterium]
MRRPHPFQAFVGGTAVVLAVLVFGGPLVHPDPALRATMELGVGLAALLAALLAFRRYAERGGVDGLVLGASLLALAFASLTAGALPVFAPQETAASLAWMRVPPLLLAAAGLAVAARLSGRSLAPRPAHVAGAAGAVVVLQVAAGAVALALAGRLPADLGERVAEGAYSVPEDVAGVALAVHGLAAGLLLLAAVGFARAAVGGDRLARWLGFGCALAAVAHVHYALHPSLVSSALSVGDVFRLAFAACLLAATVQEVAEHQRTLLAAAVARERRRLARELHDGLAQELSFLVTQTRLLAARHGRLDGLDALEDTSRRALDESRLAIGALARPGDEPLDVALEAAVADLAERMGTSVRLRLSHGVDVEPPTRDALLRIVREAMTNAVRHGGATAVSVELEAGSGLRLRVVDDGQGFAVDDAAGAPAGFGLVSMRERAEALGGQLTVASRPGEGTRVELVLP